MKNLEYYNLTIPQKSIWQTEQFYKNTSITNVSGTGRIKEKIDFDLLEKAINIVVKQNDALRIRIVIQNNEPKQYFEGYTPFKVHCVQVNNDIECEKVIRNLVTTHIDTLNEKLIKFIMFEFPDKTGGFNIVGNHMTSDAWSSAKVCSEVVNVYAKLKKQENLEETLKSSYLEFLDSEQEYVNSDKYLKDKEYWEEKFKTVPETAKILPNNEETDINSTAIRKELKIDKKMTKYINEYCKENRISAFAFLLGVYSIYLSRINGADELVIGTPMLNRKNVKEKQMIGMCVNTLPFKININEGENIKELFAEIGQNSMGMLRHQKYSYFDLIKYIRENNKDNNIILYDVVVSYQNAKTTANESEIKYSAKWNFNENISEAINIHISDIDSEEEFNMYYDYQINILKEQDILNLHKRIIYIIKQILNTENLLITAIEIITPDEKKKLLELNNTGNIKLRDETVIDIFDEIVNQYPNNIAIKCDNEEITYIGLSKMINSLANTLRKNGVERNAPVAMILDKSIDMIVGMFAIIKAGGCYVPILSDEEQSRIAYILNDCNPVCILTHKNYENLTGKRKAINLDEEKYLECEKIKNTNKPNDLIYIIYTSGSTGNPKGTKLMHKNVCSIKYSIEKDNVLKPTEKDISMSLLKYSFDASGIDIYSSLLFGGKLILIKKENELNPSIVVKIMEKEKVTRTFLIPKWIEQIANQDELQNANLSSLKILGTGGEALKPKLISFLYNKYDKLKILNLYGPTETTMFSTYQVISDKEIDNNYTSIGKPICYSRVMILGKNNTIVPVGILGELAIYEDSNSINNISAGYLNKEEETKKKFQTIYNSLIGENVKIYKTGDMVKLNDNIDIEYMGRQDDIVKINGGYLVALNEIDKRIYNILKSNYKVCSIAVPFKNTKALVVFLEKKKEVISIDNINDYINQNITFYMKPKKIVELEELPTNNSGKIDKNKLKEMAKTLLEIKKEIELPTTTTEEIIFNIVKRYSNIDKFSITDDFMGELGIDSLLLTTIYSELEFYGIELQDLYTYTNIKDLSHYIDIGKITKKETEIKNIKIKNNVKKFNLQNVLLTGVTGFLGAHLLYELLKDNNVEKVYCIIRNKNLKTSKQRFEETINYYFNKDDNIENKIKEKVVIIDGNLVEKQFGLNSDDYNILQYKITTVVNSAANVKHYAKKEELDKANINSVKNILDFCSNKISLAHISTLSIAGFRTENTTDKIFDENTIFMGQKLNNNPYLLSKITAEEIILKNDIVNSKIFRLGNIMPRIIDGKFQENYEQNAFMNAIKIALELKQVPQEFLSKNIELSPVDECTKSMIKILDFNSKNKIYHIVNDKLITIKQIVEILANMKYNVDIVGIKTFVERLNSYSGIGKYYIKEYSLKNQVNNYSLKTTIQTLEDCNFKWHDINDQYIKSIIKIINRW